MMITEENFPSQNLLRFLEREFASLGSAVVVTVQVWVFVASFSLFFPVAVPTLITYYCV